MAQNNANNPSVICVPLPSIATGDVHPLCYLPKKFVLKGVYLINEDAITADNTNYIQLNIKVGSTSYADFDSRAAHENGLVANTAKAFDLVADDQELASGSTLTCTYTEGATGTTSNCIVQLVGHWL